MNKKCPYCGFINFINAEACRKCETVLTDFAGSAGTNDPPAYRGGVSNYALPSATRQQSSLARLFTGVAGFAFGAIVFTVAIGFIRGHGSVNWIAYHPDGLGITVMMPNEPTAEQQTQTPVPGVTVTAHAFISEVRDQGIAVFAYADYSGLNIGGTSEALDKSLNGLITNSKSTLVSKSPITYQGLPGLEFECTPPESAGIRNGHGYGKILLSEPRVYIVFITASEDTDLLASKERFLNPVIPAGPHVFKFSSVPTPDLTRRPVWGEKE